jgi:hypothetical protein
VETTKPRLDLVDVVDAVAFFRGVAAVKDTTVVCTTDEQTGVAV